MDQAAITALLQNIPFVAAFIWFQLQSQGKWQQLLESYSTTNKEMMSQVVQSGEDREKGFLAVLDKILIQQQERDVQWRATVSDMNARYREPITELTEAVKTLQRQMDTNTSMLLAVLSNVDSKLNLREMSGLSGVNKDDKNTGNCQ